MDISHTRVHQMESGRENVTNEYILKFLKVLKIDLKDWMSQIQKDSKVEKYNACISILKRLEIEKLDLAHRILSQL